MCLQWASSVMLFMAEGLWSQPHREQNNGSKSKNTLWTDSVGASLHTNKQDHISTIHLKRIVET